MTIPTFAAIVFHAQANVTVPSRGDYALSDLATKLDELRARIETMSRSIALTFTRYADSLARGSFVCEPPSTSELSAMSRDQAQFAITLDAFKAFFPVVTGMKLRDVIGETPWHMDAIETKAA